MKNKTPKGILRQKQERIAKNLAKTQDRAEAFRQELISSGIVNGNATTNATGGNGIEGEKDKLIRRGTPETFGENESISENTE